MSSTPDTLILDLLELHAQIQSVMVLPDLSAYGLNVSGTLLGSRYMFETRQGPSSYPVIQNYNAGFVTDKQHSRDYWYTTVRVGARLIAGPLDAGNIGQTEDILNSLYWAIVNHYSRFDHLQTPDASGNPTAGTGFRYLEPETPVWVRSCAGTIPYRYEDRDWFGTEFSIQCELAVKRK